MKLCKIDIKGFKSINNLKSKIEPLFCLIGENNGGKSNILEAINLFLSKGASKVNLDSFYRDDRSVSDEIVIKCVFTELSEHETHEFRDWIFDDQITVEKRYSISDRKKVVHFAYIKKPEQLWLRSDYEDLTRTNLEQYPLIDYLPDSGRITIALFRDARLKYIEEHPEVQWGPYEPTEEPRGLKEALEDHLPEFHHIPAICDIQDETKTSGSALLSKILGVIINQISKQNPVFGQLEEKLLEVKDLIEGTEEIEKIEEIKQLESDIKKELDLWDISLDIGVNLPSASDIIQSSARINVDDGIDSSPMEKGHGLQRSLVFSLIRVWAKLGARTETIDEENLYTRSNFYAFEEPELYLHPQMERSTYEALKKISSVDQVMLCTHSSNFIDMNDYLNIGIVTKTSIREGTKIHYAKQELFHGNEKSLFNMARYFNHDRNEVFFAKKVILVEGSCEKSSIPLIARRLNIFDHKVSIIDCGGKYNLKIFMEVMNEFKIPYLVIHDEDPIDPTEAPDGANYDAEKYKQIKHLFNENAVIATKCESTIGVIEKISPDYESLIGIGKNQSKPYAAVTKYSDPSQTISPNLKTLIELTYKIPKWNPANSSYEYPTT